MSTRISSIDDYLKKKYAQRQAGESIESPLPQSLPSIDKRFEERAALDRGEHPFIDAALGAAKTVGRAVKLGGDVLEAAFLPPGTQQEVNPEGAAHVRAMGAGIAQGAVLDPLTGIAGIPSAVGLQSTDNNLAVNYLKRASEGLKTDAEQYAKNAGLTDSEIASAYAIGNFIGVIAPITASMKMAGFALKASTTLKGMALFQAPITDAVAGGIYGGIFKPSESGKDRLNNAIHESGTFGMGRILLTGLGMPLRGMRIRRLVNLGIDEEVAKRIEAMQRGDRPVFDTPEGAKVLAQMLNKENYLASSPAAQEIFQRVQDETHMVRAILDVHQARGSGGLVRGLGTDFIKVNETVQKFRNEFPGLKFDLVKNPEGTFDIAFGTKGLSNAQKAQLKLTGMFEGQRLYRDGAELTYIGPAKRLDYVRVRRSDGTITEIKNKNLTALPTFAEEPSAPLDAMYRDFETFVFEGAEKLAAAEGGFSEEGLIRGIREGKIQLSDDARRAFDIGGAIVYPEELGIKTGKDAIAGIRLKSAREDNPIRGLIHSNTIPGEKPWRLTVLGSDGVPQTHYAFDSIEEAAKVAQEIELIPEQIYHPIATAEGIARLISRSGTENAGLLETPSVLRFEQIFDSWVKDRGLIGTKRPEISVASIMRSRSVENIAPEDLAAARAHFADRLRKSMWNLVPEEDRTIFDRVRSELDEAINAGKIPFEAIAHGKGFATKDLGKGRVLLREISTGAEFEFGSKRVAEDALAKLERTEGDFFGGVFGLDSNGMTNFGGFRNPNGDDWLSITPEQFFLNQKLEVIPSHVFRNNRDWLQSIQQRTGIRVFDSFNEVLDGLNRSRSRYAPWGKEIAKAWKGLSKSEREEVVNFWQEIEGSTLPISEAVKLGKKRGLSAKQLAAFTRSRAIWDEGFRMAGLDGGRYIEHYYGRVRPWVDELNIEPDLKRIFGEEGVPPEFKFFAEYSRTGEMANIERDPEVVMHKWFRSMLFDQEVKPAWDKLSRLVPTGLGDFKRPALKIRDLPGATAEQIMKMNPNVSPNDDVLAKPIQDVISEFLTIIRGNPGKQLTKLRWFNGKLNHFFGIKGSDKVIEQYYNDAMSTMYGAALGARASLIVRNQTETLWTQWPRLGNKYMNESMQRAMTLEGYREALAAGVIPANEAGVPYGDAIFRNIIGKQKLTADNPLGMAVTSAMRLGLRAGQVSRKFAEEIMIPYTAGEHMGRAWSYWWQKLHTDYWLRQYEEHRIGWKKFEEEGLPFFGKPIKEKFAQILKTEGREAALQYIGRNGSDEAHWIYNTGVQPAWMQHPVGRMFGVFGTWPMWAIELYGRRSLSGTPGQIAKFWARTLALTGIFANMGVQSGVDMYKWIAPLSMIGWAGGPAVDYSIAATQIISAPMDQKADALKRFGSLVGRLSFPGQVAYTELDEALQQNDPMDAFMLLATGRHSDQHHSAMTLMFGDRPDGVMFRDTSTERAIERLMGEQPLHLDTGGVPFPSLVP